ncbi:MAG: hypothetical protein MJ247_02805 [Alphaproteobacteria bacterium]|nr:hypothetical protein [Alphaproteobacteria bacterium]
MLENTRKRISLKSDSNFVWSQKKAAADDNKTVHSNTVSQDNILFRNAQQAKEAEDRLYSQKVSQPAPTIEDKKQEYKENKAKEDNRQIRQSLGVRDAILAQEAKLGVKGIISKRDLQQAQYMDPSLVGKAKPLDVTKKDVKGLEGTRKRKTHGKSMLLPSQRKKRFNRKKQEKELEKNRNIERDKIAAKKFKKELTVTDSKGNKISIERLRKLRGLQNSTPIKRKDLKQAREQLKSRIVASKAQGHVHRGEDYTR